MPSHPRLPVLLMSAAVLVTSACQVGSPIRADTGAAQMSAQSTTAARTPAPPPAPVTKLLVIMVENHSLSQMRTAMPYTFGLARRYGYAEHYHAITHPSLPNYLAITSGSAYGIADDRNPPAHPVSGHSVFGQALAGGATAALYAQGMPAPCTTNDAGDYAVRHNPWTYFVDERAQCQAHDVSLKAFGRDVSAGHLPQVGMLIPDVKHDAHDATLSDADAFFEATMKRVFAGPDWASGQLAVVLTADEDDGHHGNDVLTVVVHPSQHHHVVTGALSHYSLTRLYDEVAGLPLLRRARRAPSMAAAFGLPLA